MSIQKTELVSKLQLEGLVTLTNDSPIARYRTIHVEASNHVFGGQVKNLIVQFTIVWNDPSREGTKFSLAAKDYQELANQVLELTEKLR